MGFAPTSPSRSTAKACSLLPCPAATRQHISRFASCDKKQNPLKGSTTSLATGVYRSERPSFLIVIALVVVGASSMVVFLRSMIPYVKPNSEIL